MRHFSYRSMSLLMHVTYYRLLLFVGISLQNSSLIPICPALNLCTHRFTVDFVITFCTLYTALILALILVWISPLEIFSGVKNWITRVTAIVNQLQRNFTFVLGIPSVRYKHTVSAQLCYHMWRTVEQCETFGSTPCRYSLKKLENNFAEILRKLLSILK